MRKRALSWFLMILLVFSLVMPLDKAYAAENPGAGEEAGEMNGEDGGDGGDAGEEYPGGENGEDPLMWEEAFPDPVFRKYVVWWVKSQGVGEITDAELQAMRETDFINISSTFYSLENLEYAPVQPDEKIQTMEGLQYFPNITVLNCNNRGIEELDISYNMKLEEVWCANNSITELDISQNEYLKYVYCYGNDGIEINLGGIIPLVKGYAEYVYLGLGIEDDGYYHSRIVRDSGVGSIVFSADAVFSYDETLYAELLEEVTAYYNSLGGGENGENGGENGGESIDGLMEDPAELFPNENFRKVVLYYFDNDNDGKLNKIELSAIAEYDECLDLSADAFSEDNKPIADTDLITNLEGIDYFESITSLDCRGRGLRKLDVSDNLALANLYVSDNALTELDLSENFALRFVHCENNEGLTLNLGSNAVLIQCYANFLNNGGESGENGLCEGYSWEYYGGEAVAGLVFSEDADIICNEELLEEYLEDVWHSTWYYLADQYDEDSSGSLSEEEIQKVTELEIPSYWSFDQTTLDGIERFTELKSLTIADQELVEIDLSQNTKLEKLVLSGITGILELDLSSLNSIKELSIENCEFTSVDITGMTALQKLDISEEESVLESIGGLDTAVALTELVMMNTALESLDISALASLEKMNVYGSASLQTITGLDNADNLVELEASQSGITSLDVSGMDSLETLSCFECKSLASLNIGAKSVKTLAFGANGLSEVTGWDQITKVVYLDCRSNPLQSIDVSGYSDLEYLLCSGCELTELNIASNAKLKYLMCQDNKISTLIIANNPDLYYLECYKNKITSLDIQANPALLDAARGARTEDIYDECPIIVWEGGAGGNSYFNEWGTESKTLVIDSFVELVQGNNVLSADEINDREKFPDLKFYLHVLVVADKNYNNVLDPEEWEFIAQTKSLYPQNLGIKSLEGLKYFEQLEELGCDGNEITVLDLSQNPNLKSVTCTDNLITELDVTGHNTLIRAVWGGPVSYLAEFVGLDGQSVIKEKTQYNVLKDYGWGPDFLWTICCDPGVNVYYDSSFKPAIVQQFPDPAFREYVLYNYDTNEDLILDTDEFASIANTGTLDVRARGIKDMTGLGYFTGLTELDCSLNYLTALDVSNNTFLSSLSCYGNFFDTLDISNNPELIALTQLSHAEGEEDDYIREELYTSTPGKILVDAYYPSSDIVYPCLIVNRFTELIDGVNRPAFKAVGMNLSNVIGLRFRVSIPEEFVKENVTMTFSRCGDEDSFDVCSIDKAKKDSEGYYIFTCYLNPLQFSDLITAELSYNDGLNIITCNYSAAQYCDALMAKPENCADTELRNLVDALRMYAICNAAASWSDNTSHAGTYLNEGEDYWGEYSDEEMMASVLEGLGDEGKMQVDIAESGVTDVMISLTLKEDTTINLYILPGDDSPVLSFSGTHKTVNGTDYLVLRGEKKSPAALGEATVFEIETSKGTATISASPMSYVAAYLNAFGNVEEKLDNCRAMIALYQYYRAAQAYNQAQVN